MSQLVPTFSTSIWFDFDDFETMYNSTDWNICELKNCKSGSRNFQLDGLNCGGVPTITTPTLTPTNTINIEQMFSDQLEAERHLNEAGFVPPLVSSTDTCAPISDNEDVKNGYIMNIVHPSSWQGGSTTITDIPPLLNINTDVRVASPPIPPHVISLGNERSSNSSAHSSSSCSSSGTGRRNIGGRRPNKENGISPEEEERRKLRRERNKQAAARCRKRREDQTKKLMGETDELEEKKLRLQDEILQLQEEKQKLQFCLESHQPNCQLRII